MKKLLQSTILTFALILFLQCGLDAQIDITDDGSGTGNTTWTADNIYILHGFVFVNDGQILTIEPGTVVKGAPGTGENASALIVARGGKILAEGTAANPIVFTFEGDPLDGSVPITTRGQWGGVILLGNAVINTVPNEKAIEGIPTSESRGLYGGNDNSDDSGVLTYVSIRHGGTDIGAGNEINGLTLGAVGSETVIDFIEVISNADDGIEFFGGVPRVKHFVSAFCADDCFDYDQGFQGKGQFWVAIQDPDNGDRGGEHDGGTDPEDGEPYAKPTIYNATYTGRGIDAGKRIITFRDNAGGHYYNSIFAGWGKGIDVEKLSSGEDSYKRFLNGDLSLSDNIFYDVASSGTSATEDNIFKVSFNGSDDNGEGTIFTASFAANNNVVADPGISYEFELGGYQLVPTQGPVFDAAAPVDDWFDNVNYKGAFEPNTTSWLSGWTLLDQSGYLADLVLGVDEISELESKVYPNPVNDKLFIELQESANLVNVQVTDIAGKQIKYREYSNVQGRISLEMNDINPGVYILIIKSNQALKSFKIIIR